MCRLVNTSNDLYSATCRRPQTCSPVVLESLPLRRKTPLRLLLIRNYQPLEPSLQILLHLCHLPVYNTSYKIHS